MACSAMLIWCAQYAKLWGMALMSWRMLTWDGHSITPRGCSPLLEPFHLRWLEEPVIPDDVQGYRGVEVLWADSDCGR